MQRISPFLLFIGIAFSSPSWSFPPESSSFHTPAIAIPNILQDIRELSHPRYQGRQTGTEGGWQSANYVMKRLAALGLVPGRTTSPLESKAGWLQQESVHAIQVVSPARVALSLFDSASALKTVWLQPGKEFLPVLDSPSGKTSGRVIFAGYGIVDPARGIDHYHGIEVHNRIVLFLRGKPPGYPKWVTHEEKAATAKEQGAAGYLTVTGPLLDRYEARKGLGQIPLAIYSALPEDHPIPGAWISGETLDGILQATNISLEKLQQSANDGRNFQSRPLPILVELEWESHSQAGTLANVIGMLPGQDPQLSHEVILIGAHRDHFGHQAGLLFPGADDNASGTAVLLELARMLSQGPVPPKRTILFASFDGEERGLLGSTHYVNHPALPLERTKAMINMDHLGVGNGKLTVGVTRMDKAVVHQVAEQAGIPDQVQIYGYFPGGDHVPFYEAGIPTITVVSSGQHANFHQASDTIASLQPDILEISIKFLFSLVTHLAGQPQ